MPAKTKKKPVRKKAVRRTKKGSSLECGVCGYRLIVDEPCGCEEEHVFLCCDQPMKKKA